MEHSTTVAQVHRSPPARVHTTARRNRSQSRHERHKCHKHRQKLEDAGIQSQITQLRTENYLLNRRLNASLSSLDSGLPNLDGLPPIDIDLKNAYQHVKKENNQLIEDVKNSRIEHEKMKIVAERTAQENIVLHQDVLMLKNLVYRLNVELEKFQDIREKVRNDEEGSKKNTYELPKYYNKNFLKPILPLLKAYTGVIQEKSEIVETLERNFDRFSVSFAELLKENETLYREIEQKQSNGNESVFGEVKAMKKEIEVLKDEKELLYNQVKLEADKLKDVHVAYKAKVAQCEKEKYLLTGTLQDVRAELCTLRGKQSVLKQELERYRAEDDSKVPMAVHTASIGECRRLFQELKNEHESEKQTLICKLKEYEIKLRRIEADSKKNEEERLALEQGNFDLAFENEALNRKIAEFDKQGQVPQEGQDIDRGTGREQLRNVKKQLKELKRKNSDLEGKLQKTRKQLQQSMAFAEDMVREQEILLAQLHEKQRENSIMVTQFGSLKNKLKNVEKGAQEGLNCVEDKMKAQEEENLQLVDEVERLTELLREKDIPEDLQKSENTSS